MFRKHSARVAMNERLRDGPRCRITQLGNHPAINSAPLLDALWFAAELDAIGDRRGQIFAHGLPVDTPSHSDNWNWERPTCQWVNTTRSDRASRCISSPSAPFHPSADWMQREPCCEAHTG